MPYKNRCKQKSYEKGENRRVIHGQSKDYSPPNSKPLSVKYLSTTGYMSTNQILR